MINPKVDIFGYGFAILQIETMSVCNMNCKFCRYSIRDDKGDTLPEKDVLSAIDSVLGTDKFEYVCFSHLNEPLLDGRVFDFIRYAKTRRLPVMIITNGLMLGSDKIIGQLLDSGPDYIKISLQTANEALFKESRGVDTSFQEYKKGLFKFLKAAQGSSIKVSVDLACNFLSGAHRIKTFLLGLDQGDPSVYNAVGDLKRDIKVLLAELKDYDAGFAFKIAGFNKYLNSIKHRAVIGEAFSLGENISIKIKPFVSVKKITQFLPVTDAEGCTNRILSILASGNVVPCCRVFGGLLSLGNIKEDTLGTILKRSNNLLRNIKSGKELPLVCRKCLGAPTKRGVFFKNLKGKLTKNELFLQHS